MVSGSRLAHDGVDDDADELAGGSCVPDLPAMSEMFSAMTISEEAVVANATACACGQVARARKTSTFAVPVLYLILRFRAILAF